MPELGSGFSDRLLEIKLLGGFIDFDRPAVLAGRKLTAAEGSALRLW
jgi:hypothetical protein